jgi:hypothetical protein
MKCQLSADASQEEGRFAGAAKEADSVPHHAHQRKTARVCSFFPLSGFAIDILPDQLGMQSCTIQRACSLGPESRL